MDLQEWDLLDDEDEEEFLQLNKIYSRNPHSYNPTNLLHVNYFICPPPPPPLPVDEFIQPTSVAPVPINLPPPMEASEDQKSPDPDPVTQVFFKKLKETEFVDTISISKPKGIIINPVPEIGDSEELVHQQHQDSDSDSATGMNNNFNHFLKWSLSGVGAICTFGVAAVCIVVFRMNKQQPHNQKLRFQIYTNDHHNHKRVHLHRRKINEDGGFRHARITFGGYCDASL